MFSDIFQDIYLIVKRLFKKPMKFLKLVSTIGSSIMFAFVLWRCFMLFTDCLSPIVVVLSGSMEPGIYRGDILLLNKFDNINIGDIVVYRQQKHQIPIVHRVISIHSELNGEKKLLTKGDNNNVNDRSLYKPGDDWLSTKDIMGTAYTIIPKLGMPTIWFNEYKFAKPLLITLMIIGLLMGKEL